MKASATFPATLWFFAGGLKLEPRLDCGLDLEEAAGAFGLVSGGAHGPRDFNGFLAPGTQFSLAREEKRIKPAHKLSPRASTASQGTCISPVQLRLPSCFRST